MHEQDPSNKFIKRAIIIPGMLDEILSSQAARSDIPKNTLARHYIINGLLADGVQISPDDIEQIEADIEQLRQESPIRNLTTIYLRNNF